MKSISKTKKEVRIIGGFFDVIKILIFLVGVAMLYNSLVGNVIT